MMKKIKALLKSREGMTFVELLTALALLVIIIASFTPMLLNSYETLYKAGEINEETYKAKTEIEEVLAGRDSDTISRYQIAFENLTSKMFLNMRKAMENCQNGIQTAFYGGKGTITVVSQSVMPDDEPFKDVTVQFNGINITSVVEGNSSSAAKNGNEYTVAIEIVTPTWGADTASGAEAFDPTKNALDIGKYDATLVVKNNKKYADIKIKDGVDVITTAVKIIAHFYDENGKLDKAEAYVRITPATIMLVGKTSNSSVTTEDSFDANNNGTIEDNEKYTTSTNAISYYTSKGVDKREVAKDVINSEGKLETETATVYRFKAFPRELRTANNPAGTRYPAGTEFLSVNYIDNDKDLNLVPYYVLTGTNGVIQRLFISTGNISGITKITGYNENNLRGVEYKDGGLTKKLYPTFWGGDKSHQFGYSTSTSGSSYDYGCWYTGSGSKGDLDYDKYGIQTKMAMYFNGFGTEGGGYNEAMRNGRKISYILLETGTPLRGAGSRAENKEKAKWGGFITVWESPKNHTLYYITGSTGSYSKWSDGRHDVISVNRYSQNTNTDEFLSYLNLKSFNNISTDYLFRVGADGDEPIKFIDDSNINTQNINISAAFYNPSHLNEDNTYGKMMYLGCSPAYAYLQQTDNISTDGNYANWYDAETGTFNWDKNIPTGAFTSYVIQGSVSNGTSIIKCSENDKNMPSLLYKMRDGYKNAEETKIADAEFFVSRNTSINKKNFSDVEFTMGYSSNREQVFANVTYGTDKTEYHNYCERYYNLSHYADIARSNGSRDGNTDFLSNSYVSTIVDNGATYTNNVANDMYNVWFPGEFYNLTQTATKDGVTVAVGYTVSGSTFQWVNPNQTTNTSTALGSVYNDGVLAVMPSSSASFQNILYYKDTEGFENNNITGNSTLATAYNAHTNMKNNGYGTHGRRSVRFTAVDICIFGGTYNHETKQIDQKSIYAVYGDNHGRVFFSLIGQVDYPKVPETAADKVTGTTKLATRIKSLGSTTSEATDKATLIHYDDNSKTSLCTMNEFKDKDGNSMSTHFSEITNITVDEHIIYVTGRSNGSQELKVAICDADSAGLQFHIITIEEGKKDHLINDMVVLGGYLYIVGETTGGKGFWYAIDTGVTKSCVGNNTDKDTNNDGIGDTSMTYTSISACVGGDPIGKNKMFYQELPTPIYSIAGRNT